MFRQEQDRQVSSKQSGSSLLLLIDERWFEVQAMSSLHSGISFPSITKTNAR
jgi:hypothetical protein